MRFPTRSHCTSFGSSPYDAAVLAAPRSLTARAPMRASDGVIAASTSPGTRRREKALQHAVVVELIPEHGGV